MLRFVVDESPGRAVADLLESLGHDVVNICSACPSADDADILSLALNDQRIVITNDKDFGELVFRSGKGHAGVLLFRLEDETATNRVKMAGIAVERYGSQLTGCFTVVTERTIRIRPMR